MGKPTRNSIESDIDDFESEIITPDNDYNKSNDIDPNIVSNVGKKVEKVIDKAFDILFDVVKKIID